MRGRDRPSATCGPCPARSRTARNSSRFRRGRRAARTRTRCRQSWVAAFISRLAAGDESRGELEEGIRVRSALSMISDEFARAHEKATLWIDALEHAFTRAARSGNVDRPAEPRGRGQPFLADRSEAGAPRPERQDFVEFGARALGITPLGRPVGPKDGSSWSRDREVPAVRSRGSRRSRRRRQSAAEGS